MIFRKKKAEQSSPDTHIPPQPKPPRRGPIKKARDTFDQNLRRAPGATRFKEARDLQGFIDASLDMPSGAVESYVNSLIKKHPHDTPQQLIDRVTKSYLRGVSGLSAGVGAGAAYPGLGTGAATALSVAEVGAFFAQTAWYVLVVTRIHGVSVYDKDKRRTLVLSAMLGEEGARIVSTQLGLATITWAKAQFNAMSGQTLATVNRYLAKYAAKKISHKLGKNLIGKLVPFGIGAVIGWFGGRAMGLTVVEGVRAALGTPPLVVPWTVVGTQRLPENVIVPAQPGNSEGTAN